MRILIIISRVLVGSLFIVSGLIKANDPLGFGYKLEEYFAESALNLPGLMPFALGLGILACLAEVVLGFAVLFGGRMKLATWALLLLTLFFGWLTAYTATCDPNGTYTVMVDGVEVTRGVTCVTDCGCFGDAMKGSVGRSLTPWESFTKDMVLLVFVLPLFFHRKHIGFNTAADDRVLLPAGLVLVAFFSWVFTWWFPVLFTAAGMLGYLLIKRLLQGPKAEWATAGWIAVFTLAFTWYTVQHLPLRDYRPYAEGNSIAEQQQLGKAPVQQIFLVYRNTATGEEKEFDSGGQYPWDDPTWEFVEQRVNVLEEGIDSPVADFLLNDADGNDLTADILGDPSPVLLVMMYNVDKTDPAPLDEIAALATAAFGEGMYVYGISASLFENIEAVRHEHQLPFEFLQCDEKTIKTVVRSNPGVVLLREGVVLGKWHANDVPTINEVKGKLKDEG